MVNDEGEIEKFYRMLIAKDSSYEGIFFVGVKTTGIFCSPTCPAKKPYKENCEFFYTAEEALLASYRPCKRCKPLTLPSRLSEEMKKLVEAVEANPEKKWTDKDFSELNMSANTARRQFKKQFGMTFIHYARARRLGIALNHIRNGAPIIEVQLDSNYESGNGFREAFTKIMGTVPTGARRVKVLYSTRIETLLGSMVTIYDEDRIYLLEFADKYELNTQILKLGEKLNAVILPDHKDIVDILKAELTRYFRGENIIPFCEIYLV